MILYDYDQEGLHIVESKNNEDTEFNITIKNEGLYLQSFQQVRSFFENNKIYTDVLFYKFQEQNYRVIVRKDYYVDFLICMFKHQLLKSLAWNK